MSDVSPARIGLLFDYIGADGGYDENVIPSLQLVADAYLEQGVLERPVEFVVRQVQGLPRGSFRAVRDAFFELVEEDALVIFGPWVSENGAALTGLAAALGNYTGYITTNNDGRGIRPASWSRAARRRPTAG